MYQEKDKYRLLIKNLPDGFAYHKIVLDSSGKPLDYIFLEVNSAFEVLTGLPRDHIIGKKVTELYPGIDEGLGFDWIGIYDKVATTGQSIHFKQYFDQQERWYDITAYSDQPGYFAVVFHDITDRKQAEEALKESKERYSHISEILSDIAYSCILKEDGNYTIDWMTGAVELITGYTIDELKALRCWRFIVLKEDLFLFEQHVVGLAQGASRQCELRVRHKNGDIHWLRSFAQCSPQPDDTSSQHLYGGLIDITERKQAEEDLAKAEQRLSAHIDNSPLAIIEFDPQFRVIRWSKVAERIFGWTSEEIIGKSISEMRWVYADDKELVLQESAGLLKGERSRSLNVNRNYRKDGSIILCEWYDSGIYDETGHLISIFSQVLDITERKQAELLILIQRDLAMAISFSHELDKALLQCLDTIAQLSEMDCGGIYLMDQDSGDLNLICNRNLSPAFIKSVSHYKADSTHARLVLQGKPIFTRYPELGLPLSQDDFAEKLRAFAVLPLIFENRVIGCLNLASKKLEDVSEINREVLKTAATLMGEGITRLQTEEKLKLTNQKLQKAIKSTIQAIALILEKRDPYTAGHQKRMTKLACAIAEEISLSPDKIEGLYIAGIIHDIGKVNVPTEILSKPGRLSEIELSLIKTHPQVGSDILKEMELPGEVSSIVLQHHERIDGSGYPSGLSGEAILLEARILAVADVVEAMASHRPYRPALGLDKALEEITKNKGKLYDPEVVDACLKLFKEKGFKFE